MVNKIISIFKTIKNNMAYKRVNIEEIKEEVIGPVEDVTYHIYDIYDKYVRTYSVKEHGKDAEKMAKQFAIKINGKIK